MKRVEGMGFRENGESIGCRVYEDYKILRVKSIRHKI